MNTERWIIALLVVAMASYFAGAGPLAPAPGPVQPTYKTLDDVNPSTPLDAAFVTGDATALFIIKEPGAYHLVRDITGDNGMDGIRIDTSDVTIDLRGFNVRGTSMSGDGIVASPNAEEPDDERRFGIVVRGHGRVFGWDGRGIDLSLADRSRVEDVIVTSCRSGGVSVGNRAQVRRVTCDANIGVGLWCGRDAIVDGCALTANDGGDGLRTGDRAIVTSTHASGNGGDGMVIGRRSGVTGCVAANNAGDGIETSEDAVIDRCVARSNAGNGMNIGPNGLVRGSTANGNQLVGFLAASDCSFDRCKADSNIDRGFLGADRTRWRDCDASDNGQQGFESGRGSLFRACHAAGNTIGFETEDGSAIESCTGYENTNDVYARINCTIIDCRFVGDNTIGGVGIEIDGGNGIIKDNFITRRIFGIDIAATDTLVVGNYVTQTNDPYGQIASGNKVGSILTDPADADATDNFQD